MDHETRIGIYTWNSTQQSRAVVVKILTNRVLSASKLFWENGSENLEAVPCIPSRLYIVGIGPLVVKISVSFYILEFTWHR